MEALVNVDLFSVGIAAASIIILGAMVFFKNPHSVTHRTFFFFSIFAVLWSAFNYAYQQPNAPHIILLLLRIHAFFAVWYVFFLFRFFYVFPRDVVAFSKFYKYVLLPLVIAVSVSTLTPLVFMEISELSVEGRISQVMNGPGIFVFAATVIGLIIAGPIIFWKRRHELLSQLERKQFVFVSIGTLITFSLHLIFNLVLPAFFGIPRFIQLGAVFIFPFIAFTAYAIFRHHLLNIKVITTEGIVFLLAVVTLFEILISQNLLVLVFRSGVFALVLAFGILLIRSVLREVEQREQLEVLNKQLVEEKAKVEDLSRFKTQLLSLASHQIKAPLAAIKGFVQILNEGLYGEINDKVKEVLGKIRYSTDDLINLINTLLDIRKVEEGRMEYQFARVDFKKLVGEVVEELRPLASNGKKLEFTFNAPKEDIFVNADASKLKQVVQNLLDNALKYTPKGFVKAELKNEKERGTVLFVVEDSGLGIAKDLLPHLFEEFIRDERVKQEIRGTGLGLFIAKKIIEAHGGSIGASSEGEDKGSVFWIRLRKL